MHNLNRFSIPTQLIYLNQDYQTVQCTFKSDKKVVIDCWICAWAQKQLGTSIIHRTLCSVNVIQLIVSLCRWGFSTSCHRSKQSPLLKHCLLLRMPSVVSLSPWSKTQTSAPSSVLSGMIPSEKDIATELAIYLGKYGCAVNFIKQ